MRTNPLPPLPNSQQQPLQQPPPTTAEMPKSFSTNSPSKTPSIQSTASSESNPSIQASLITQTFSVIYDNTTFLVDPYRLRSASNKFSELIEPFLKDNYQFDDLKLEIAGNEFSKRNIENFLKLCQNLPTDVQNSEMEEICRIAKLFKAEQIYHVGSHFIQRYIDPNFNVSDELYNEYNKQTYLFVLSEKCSVHHENNLQNLEFDENFHNDILQPLNQPEKVDLFNQTQNLNSINHTNNTNSINHTNNTNSINHTNNTNSINQTNNTNSINQTNNTNLSNQTNNTNSFNQTNNVNSSSQNSEKVNKINKNDDSSSDVGSLTEKTKSIIYQVRCEKRSLKLPKYLFCMNGSILYTAKQKENDIIIGEGSFVHMNHHKENHVGHIVQESNHRINQIKLKGQSQFTVKYVDSTKENHLSLEVTFYDGSKKVTWTPKAPHFSTEKNRFCLDLSGMWNHSFIKSKRNIVLQNSEGKDSFIVRKVEQNVFEIEASPKYDPLLMFAIGISEIVGPYIDYFNEINDVF